jgi:hypothetical protein
VNPVLDEWTQRVDMGDVGPASVHDYGGIPARTISKRLPNTFERGGVDDPDVNAVPPSLDQLVHAVREFVEVAAKVIRKGLSSLLPMDAVAHAELAECNLAMLAVIEDGWSVGDDLNINGLHPTAPRATVRPPPRDPSRIHRGMQATVRSRRSIACLARG